MALLIVPACLVEPLKIVALFMAGKGHWVSGTAMIVGAYAVSLLIIERLFKVVKPKLMTLGWFSSSWNWILSYSAKFSPQYDSVTDASIWRALRRHRLGLGQCSKRPSGRGLLLLHPK